MAAWHALARDTVVLGTAAVLLGAMSLAIRLDVPWVAPPPPPEPAACGLDEVGEPGIDAPARPELARMPVTELNSRLTGVVVVDARSAEAFADSHIPGAISMPADDIDTLVATQSLPLPVDLDIVAYCDREDGLDALYVGLAIDAALGCGRVRVLDGGFAAWLAANAPVEGIDRSG
jgi:rhodanese-related sulfurtransferase